MNILKSRPLPVVGIDIGNSTIKAAVKQGKIKNDQLSDNGNSLAATIVFRSDGYTVGVSKSDKDSVKVDDIKLHIGAGPRRLS